MNQKNKKLPASDCCVMVVSATCGQNTFCVLISSFIAGLEYITADIVDVRETRSKSQ
jgi:hypothetical protein